MAKTCLKCGYVRQPTDKGPAAECPKCGAIYAMVKAAKKKQKPPQTQKNEVKAEEPEEEVQEAQEAQEESKAGEEEKEQQPLRQYDLLKELALLMNSRYGLIWLKTVEEERAEKLLRYLSKRMSLEFFTWTVHVGLYQRGAETPIYGTTEPGAGLDQIDRRRLPGVYHIQGICPFLSDPVLRAKLIRTARTFKRVNGALVITGCDLGLPEEINIHTAIVDFPSPTPQEYGDLLQRIYRDLSRKMQIKVAMSPDDVNQLLNNMRGLTLIEAEKILTKAIVEDGKLAPDDIRFIIQAKKDIIEREGWLEYYPAQKRLHNIAAMMPFKTWLKKRKSIITRPQQAAQFGLAFPKGILLAGLPGTGKSLCAQTVAAEWGLPLLKMDPVNLYKSDISESERNFRRAMETAEKVAPVILWIDEIEQAFSTELPESGTSWRVLNTFLTWMQERKGDVFVIATSNDVTKLPAEFQLRKGRFDEIFFVDLPDSETRAKIFGILLKERKQNPTNFDLGALAQAAKGFSGIEIEQVIVAAMYTAFSQNSQLTTEFVLGEIKTKCPLAKARPDHVKALRKWGELHAAKA